VRITARNPTSRRIYVPAFWFTVKGVSLARADMTATDQAASLARIEGDELVSTYAPSTPSEVVAQRRIVFDKSAWWEPQDKTNDECIFAIPKERFDFLEMRVSYLSTRFGNDIGAVRWDTTRSGEWKANLVLSPSVGKTVENWSTDTASGFNWYTVTLSLLPQKSTAAAPTHNIQDR
jgi:hypothetical protein